jgi:hypothetical protein
LYEILVTFLDLSMCMKSLLIHCLKYEFMWDTSLSLFTCQIKMFFKYFGNGNVACDISGVTFEF